MERRGQAAMEFLMTYGWAILAAIIAIGVLAYFGVFSPGQYVGSSAIVTAPWYANAWNVDDSDDSVNLELINNGGDTVFLGSVVVDGDSDGTAVICTYTGAPDSIASGDTTTILAACAPINKIANGQTFRGDITITYQRTAGGLELTSTGTITDTVRA